jgi:hypothetical protein
MDFSLTEEQRAIREMARRFALAEVDPIVDEIDEAQKFPLDVMRKAAELGFLGIIFPEEYGGAGLGYLEYVLIVTELSKVDPSVGISVAAHNSLGTNHIYKFGNSEQRQRWVTPLASGQKIAAWALTEPGSGSDAAGACAPGPSGWPTAAGPSPAPRRSCTQGSVGGIVRGAGGDRPGARSSTGSPRSSSKRACRGSAAGG